LRAVRAVATDFPPIPVPRHAYFSKFRDADGSALDQGLVLFFRGPQSFTGDDVVELHGHGSPRLLQLLLSSLLRTDLVRLAEPGEFTRRAFLNGRIDLARAEAVRNLILAESEVQVRSAAAQLVGELSTRLSTVRKPLLELRADLEGTLDFPDDVDDPEALNALTEQRLQGVLATLEVLVEDASKGALVRRGARIVLFGPVNAGKSTLFNRLVGNDRAIVDAEPGTTRDALEAKIEIEGVGFTLVDTAGLRETPGRIEAQGIERARQAVQSSDVAILVVPPDASAQDIELWRMEAPIERRLEVLAKCDLRSTWNAASGSLLLVSAHTGEGLTELRQRLLASVSEGVSGAAHQAADRHLDALRRALEATKRADLAVRVSTTEVVAGEIGVALRSLSEITGEDASEELLNEIFSRFCIGK
jgi:tRNA modification GTPase